MRLKHLFIVLLLGCLPVATACAPEPAGGGLRGTLLVWHTWPGPAGELMSSLLDSFMAINPQVVLVSEYVDEERLVSRFLSQTEAGLGPDLLIGLPPPVIAELAVHERLANLAALAPNLSDLNEQAVAGLWLDEHLYGVPLATHTQLLFYNKRQAATVPTHLSDLLAAAQEGQISALPVDFYHSYWGLHGFAGKLAFDGSKIDLSHGLKEWLEWLQLAQREPKIILSDSASELYEMFATEQATFLVADSTQLPALRSQLGVEEVGVAYLPANDLGAEASDEDPDLQGIYRASVPPGSFLELEVAAVSRVSSQPALSAAVIAFLTNAVQQRQIATSDLGYAPVNQRIRFDHRLSPAEMTLVRQSATAPLVPLRAIDAFAELRLIADDGYAQVLGGVLEAAEGAELIHTTWREKG